MPEAYKNRLRLFSFYDFLSENRGLFNKEPDKPLDFLAFFNNNLVGINICDRQALLNRLLELYLDNAELRMRNFRVVVDLFDGRLQALYKMLDKVKTEVSFKSNVLERRRYTTSVALRDIYNATYVYNEVLTEFAKAYMFIYDFDNKTDDDIFRYFSYVSRRDVNDKHLCGYDLNLDYFFNYAKSHDFN